MKKQLKKNQPTNQSVSLANVQVPNCAGCWFRNYSLNKESGKSNLWFKKSEIHLELIEERMDMRLNRDVPFADNDKKLISLLIQERELLYQYIEVMDKRDTQINWN